MSDTTLRDCIICEKEGDCIEGICSNCAAEDDLTHYMSATSRLSKKSGKLQADNERLREALERIQNWAIAYPLSVFPEPDFAKVRKALKKYNITLGAVSASNMRHVIKGISDIVEQALKGE